MSQPSVQETIAAILRKRGVAPPSNGTDAILGSDGLGLDSIAIADVILDCETTFGRSFVELLEESPLRVSSLMRRASE
jgi:acyl carrier protein